MIWNGKVYRNLEQQVEYLTEYLADQAELTELGIKVIGEAAQVSDIPPDDPDDPYEFGDAYLIGTEPPYTMYIWTRANGNHPEDFWFNVGRFPMPGPQGEPGIGLDDATGKTLGDWTDVDSEQYEGNITTITMEGVEVTTVTDNTAYSVVKTIQLPNILTDGQVTVDTHNNYIRIKLAQNLANTYVGQKGVYDAVPNYVRGIPLVYGRNVTSTGKINAVSTIPIMLGTENNLVMYGQKMTSATDYDEANNNVITSSYSRFNTVLGKANQLTGGDGYNANTENSIFGGKNILYSGVQDSATFGYRNNIYANQALTSGYKNTNKGSESIVIGNQNTLNGTITVDPDGDGASSNTKQMAIFGYKINIGYGNQTSLIAGDQHTIGNNSKWNFAVGAYQNLGKHNACVNALDYGNTTGDYVEDSTMIGYGNHIYGGSSGSVVYAVNILGNNCSNRSNNANFKKVSMIGEGLVASRDDQIIMGRFNQTNPYDTFQLGNGTADDYRSNLFAISNDPLDGPMIMLGGVSLTAAQITALKALI